MMNWRTGTVEPEGGINLFLARTYPAPDPDPLTVDGEPCYHIATDGSDNVVAVWDCPGHPYATVDDSHPEAVIVWMLAAFALAAAVFVAVLVVRRG
jgi:hypothetical protein